jgi:putative heme iron utilization protein
VRIARPLDILAAAVLLLFVGGIIAAMIADPAPSPLCATHSARDRLVTRLIRPAEWDLASMAHETGLSEAVVLDALPEPQRVGVQASELPRVLELLRAWPDPVMIIEKAGHQFKIRGPLQAEAFARSGVFHVRMAGVVTAELDTLSLGAIYAYIDRRGGTLSPGIVFLDSRGEVIFEVLAHASDPSTTQAVPPEFQTTFQRMAALAPACKRTH